MKKICVFIIVLWICTSCSISDISSFSQNPDVVKTNKDEYKLSFEHSINAEEWTLITWDKEKRWENLVVFLKESEGYSIAFKIIQEGQTNIFLLQEGSETISLNPNFEFELMAQVNGEIESKAKIQGELTLS